MAIAILEQFSRPPYQVVCAWLGCSFIRADRRIQRVQTHAVRGMSGRCGGAYAAS
jgi:hypothetical protein